MTTLEAKKREQKADLDALRAEGMIPAVVYGPKHDSMPISVEARAFTKAFREAGESTTVTLDIEGQKVETLVQDVAHHPVKEQFLHVDFLAIDASKPVEVAVPLEFEGVSPAVKTGLGTLVKVLHEVEIAALPKDLPHQLVVDIAALETADSQISAADIKLPAGVTLVTAGEEVVATIAVAQEESEESAPVDLSSIEVEKKGKKEEEEVPAE